MARRRYQRGTLILRRGKRRTVWVGRFLEDERLVDGTVRRIHRSVVLGDLKELPTRRLADRELSRRLVEINSATYSPPLRISFQEFAVRWERHILPQHKPSTRQAERTYLNRYLIPSFGEKLLREISAESLQAWLSLQQKNPKTVRNAVLLLRSMWRTAEAWGYVQHNPFARLVLPSLNPTERRYLTLEEAKSIIVAASEPWRTLFWVVAETGLRASEAFGLRVDDADAEHGLVFVRQSVWRGKVQTPKTVNATRVVAVSPQLSDHLKAYLETHWKPNAHRLLFVNQAGRPLSWKRVVEQRLHPILEKLSIPRCGLHAFRHGVETVMDRWGVPLKVRQQRLGHSDPRTTLGVYTHAVGEDERKLAEKLGNVFCLSLPTPEENQATVQ